MNFKECEDNLKVGQKVWICDFRLNGTKGADKPRRHIKPTFVEIFSNDDLPKNKRVYYSEVHFRPLNKKGVALARIIAPFDNTGYRGFTGIALNIFISETECKAFYKKQCENAIKDLKAELQERIVFYNEEINKIEAYIEIT